MVPSWCLHGAFMVPFMVPSWCLPGALDLPVPSLGFPGVLLGPFLGLVWALPGPLLGPPWATLVPSLGSVGIHWALPVPSWAFWVVSLGLSGPSLGLSCALPWAPCPPPGLAIGPSWSLYGWPSCGLHGALDMPVPSPGLPVVFLGPFSGLVWACPWPLLGPPWAPLVHPLGSLGLPWALPGASWAFWGFPLCLSGPSLGLSCALLWAPWPPPWACQWAFSGHPMVAHVPPGPTPWAHSRHRRAQGWTKEGPMHPRRPQEGSREGPARAQGGPTQGQRRTPGRHQGGPGKAPGGPQEGHGETQAQTNPYERNGQAQ